MILRLFTLLFIGTCAVSAFAEHPVPIVKANVFVQKYKTTMRLEYSGEDLEHLQGVEPQEDGTYDEDELLDAHEDHVRFLQKNIEITDVNGNIIKSRITDIGPFEIPESGIFQGLLPNYTLTCELEFRYEDPPEALTISQNMIAEGDILPCDMKILLKQSGSDIPILHMMKADKPRTWPFDWTRPPLTSDLSEEERAKWFEAQSEKALGIDSYSSIYNFIYVTETEVRQEILFPLASLSSFMELESKDGRFLEIEEQDAIKPKIEALLTTSKTEVKIDGVAVAPRFDRIDFYGLDVRDFMAQAERGKVSLNGRVGIIMSYPTKGAPKEVQLKWLLFNEVVKTVDGIVFEYEKAKRHEFGRYLSDDANTYRWSDSGRPALPPIENIASDQYALQTTNVPVLSIILAALGFGALIFARGLLGDRVATAVGFILLGGAFFAKDVGVHAVEHQTANVEKQDEIFAQLHKNVFRAFDYQQEEAIYDALANSVAGEQLRELYIDVRESLRVAEQGGAVARIDEVNFEEGELASASQGVEFPGFGYRCKWNLVGTIEHWGHLHQRTNIYDAVFDVELVDDAWKITSMQIQDQEQGKITNRRRKVNEGT